MSITNHPWPPDEYSTNFWPPNWLRYETEYPDSGRPSRLLAHANVPYHATISEGEDLAEALKTVAAQYLARVRQLIGSDWISKDGESYPPDVAPLLPDSWHDRLAPDAGAAPPGEIEWLDIWPPIGSAERAGAPTLASWNLSRKAGGGLPATVVMTAAERYVPEESVLSYSFGVRVPMAVETEGGRIRVVIRSMTAEYPAAGYFSVTEARASSDKAFDAELTAIQSQYAETSFASLLAPLSALSADSALLNPKTMNAEQLLFSARAAPPSPVSGLRVTLAGKGAPPAPDKSGYSIRPRFPVAPSYQVVSAFDFDANPGAPDLKASTETCPLVTHAATPGQAEVFVQTPPGWVAPGGDRYRYTLRRPTRTDDVLEIYRIPRDIGPTAGTPLEAAGFKVMRCPEYVPEDKDAGPGVKSVALPGGDAPAPRRNDFSAIMAYCHSVDFFALMQDIGLPPALFVVRAQPEVEIYYRYGIFPGPGRGGRTINAQVAYDCTASAQSVKPAIRMNLALANLNRWSRPENPDATPVTHADRRYLRPEPLGIASSGRWMLHEFGHYLIAARLGQLEFDFAHSAGDAMAAVWYDPYSRLGNPGPDVSARFRGITYPFVFTTRRHDRSPLLGWAWYGTLNRSVLTAPPVNCDTLKGYLTEQILSSSIFRLYRALGGDTVGPDGPDDYIRYRASFMTLHLLIRAIAGFAQSPSRAEMLELGMEEVDLLMTAPLAVPAPPHGVLDTAPAPVDPDSWSGGVSHKVVRWAFEAQGMFVDDETKTTNTIGRAAPVDIFVRDRRPHEERQPGGTVAYGPGSYVPVSLDWTGAQMWMVEPARGFTIGNRGQQTVATVHMRFWLGKLGGDMAADRWDLGDNIKWGACHSITRQLDLAPRAPERVKIPDPIIEAIKSAGTEASDRRIVLLEISCDDDLANSDPKALLACAIPDGNDPPVTPRALADLVAGDNNLGLMRGPGI